MTIQERKLKLINKLSATNDEALIKKMELLLKNAITEEYEKSLTPMTQKVFLKKIEEAEEDIKHGRLFSQKEVEKFFKNKFK